MSRVNQPQKSSWKKSSREDRVPAQGTGNDEFGRRGRSRRRLIFLVSALGTLAVGLGVILAIVLLRRPSGDLPLIFAGVGQSSLRAADAPLPPPPNPFVLEDATLMHTWFNEGADQSVRFIGAVTPEKTGSMKRSRGDSSVKNSALLNTILRQLSDAEPGGPKGDMIAVFVTAAGTTDDGEPYFLAGDSLPMAQSETKPPWVSVRSVLEGIKKALETGDLAHKNARVVVFLDGGRIGEAWDWGIIDQSFTKACKEVASSIASSRIAVIASCNDGQRSWCDPRRGRSLFAEAIVEGFTGDGDDDGDGVITVGELENYLAVQVAADAKAIWAADQRPVLLTPDAKSWQLIVAPEKVDGPNTANRDIDELAVSFTAIDELWEGHSKLANRAHSPLITRPLAWAVLEKKLARLDLLAVAGSNYAEELDSLKAECKALIRDLSLSPGPTSSALPEIELSEYFHGPMTLSASQSEFLESLSAKPLGEVKDPGELTQTQLAPILWRWLKDDRQKNGKFDNEKIQHAGVLLNGVKRELRNNSSLLETHLIRLITSDSKWGEQYASRIVETHQLSRESLLLPDIRASFWVRHDLAKVDLNRMFYVDLLFGDNVDSTSKIDADRMAHFSTRYGELQTTGHAISNAYQLRDEMLHYVPRIAETLLSDARIYENANQIKSVASKIEFATNSARELTAKLRLSDDRKNTKGIVEDFTEIQAKADKALADLRIAVAKLDGETAAIDEMGIRTASAALQGSGLHDAKARKAVHDRMLEILRSDTRSQQSLASKQSTTIASMKSESHFIDKQHPWLYWHNQTKSFNGKVHEANPKTLAGQKTDVQAQTKELRHAIAKFSDTRFDDVLAAAVEQAKDGQSLSVVRQPAADLDLRCRCQTALITNRVDSIRQAIKTRFDLDSQLFILDHISRTIGEFWCEAREGEFAHSYVAHATKKLTDVLPLGQNCKWLDGVNVNDESNQAQAVATSEKTLVPRPEAKYSRGVVPGFLGDARVLFEIKRPPVLPRGRVLISTANEKELRPLGDKAASISLGIPADKKLQDAFVVKSFFRGMQRTGSLKIVELSEPRVTSFKRPDYTAPTALLESGSNGPGNIVIVLDCSGSMIDNRKLSDAKQALFEYTDVLSRNNSHAALVIFGHRFSWKLNKNGKLIAGGKNKFKIQQAGRASIGLAQNAGHNPNRDVEVALGLKEMSNARLGIFKDAIRQLNSVGQTPTYLAILRAYETLNGKPGQIVVLTDGVPKLAGMNSEYIDKAKTAYKKNLDRVQLTIVDFQNKENQKQLKANFPEARIVDADSFENLQKQLVATIDRWSIVWKYKDVQASERVSTNENTIVDPWPPNGDRGLNGFPQSPALDLMIEATDSNEKQKATAEVQVEGGEAFRLRVDGDILRHLPFDRTNFFCHDLHCSDADFRATAIRPTRNQNRSLDLRLVLEKHAGRFTPRPSDVWVELTGIDAQGNEDIQQISMTSFQTGYGVPVIFFQVTNWPESATRFKLKAFLRFQDNKMPATELSLTASKDVSLPGIAGVKFSVEDDRQSGSITVTEAHEVNATVGLHHIQLEPQPSSAKVQVYQKERLVVRKFEYDEKQSDLKAFVKQKRDIANSKSLILETRKAIPVNDGR